MKEVFTVPYPGSCISVNSMKIVRGGRRTHHNRPETQDWIDELAEKTKQYRGDLETPIKVGVFCRFRDNRHPDPDNLFKAICDGLKIGLGVDDKHFFPRVDGVETGYTVEYLEITLEDALGDRDSG